MRWETLKEHRELKDMVNRIDYIVFKYFKGTIKEAIDQANKADFLEDHPDLSVEDYKEEWYGFITDDELPERFPKEFVSAKISLLGEMYRRMNDTHDSFVLKELENYQFIEGILSEDDLDYLYHVECYHYLVEFVLDNIEIPEHNLYPLPEKLAGHLCYDAFEAFDAEKKLLINCGLGEIVVDYEVGDKPTILGSHTIPAPSAIMWTPTNLLSSVLTWIRFNANYIFLLCSEKITDNYFDRYKDFSAPIEEQDAIIYLSDKLGDKVEDSRIGEIYEKMKPNARLVTVVNSSWLKHPFAKRKGQKGLAQCLEDHSIISVTELPKGIWRETEDSTSIVVIWKSPSDREDERVLFIDASSCAKEGKKYALDEMLLAIADTDARFQDDADEAEYRCEKKGSILVCNDELIRNDGYLIPALYLNQIELEEVRYGKRFWQKFDARYEGAKLENCNYSKDVIFSVLLHLFEDKKIQIIRSGDYDNDDEECWHSLLSISGKEFEKAAGDDDGAFFSERLEDSCDIVVDRAIFETSQFIQSVLSDLVQNENQFVVYKLISFLSDLRLEPFYNDEIDDSLFENGDWCFDIFRHIIDSKDIITSLSSNELSLFKLIQAVVPEVRRFIPAVEFARLGGSNLLLPSSFEREQFDLYCRAKTAELFFSLRSMDIRYPFTRANSCKELFVSPFIGATYQNEEGKVLSLDLWSAACAYVCLTDNGHLVNFFPASVLTSNIAENKSFRKVFTDKNSLDRIVLLPKDLLPHTGINICMVEFRKGRDASDSIVMIDARECYTINEEPSKFNGRNLLELNRVKELLNGEKNEHVVKVSRETIVEDGYSWSPVHYCTNEVDIPEGYESARFEEIGTVVKGRKVASGERGYTVQISDLCNSPYDYDFVAPNKQVEVFADNKQITCVEEPVLLLSSVRSLHPTFCEASPENPVFIEKSVYAFHVDTERVCLPYLVSYLAQIDKSLSQGNYIPRNSLLDIKSLKIVFPKTKEVQLAVVEESKRAYQESQLKELGLLETIEKMKADYINEVRMRKHDMKPHMSQLKNSFKILERLVEKIEGNAEIVSSIKDYLGRQKVALDIMSDQLAHLSDEQVYGNPEVFDAEEYLSKIKPSSSLFQVHFHKDALAFQEAELEKAYIHVAPLDFSNLVSNIMENAVRHGFKDSSRGDYFFDIYLSLDSQNLVITFSNNGDPFPEGMDKLRYGLKGEKGGLSAGTGVGGYRVRSIAEHYGGSYDISESFIDESGAKTVDVIITLPIYYDDEQV